MILKLIPWCLSFFIILASMMSCTKKIYDNNQISPPDYNNIPPPKSGMQGAKWYPSPNYGTKKTPPFVILHHTATSSLKSSLRTLTGPKTQVSSHYVIDQNGAIYQIVDEQNRAWHAGVSSWHTIRDINSSSIGIEIVNSGKDPFAPEQIKALKVLLADLKKRYNIPARNFIGHLDIAPARKVDPSVYFPWEELAQEGYGIWYNQNEVENKTTYLPVFDPIWAFAIIGYDTINIQATIKAFKQHYLKEDPSIITPVLDDRCYRVLYSLVKNALSIPTVITGPQDTEPIPDLYFGNGAPTHDNLSKDNNYPELESRATEK